jgi:hypothetical protein
MASKDTKPADCRNLGQTSKQKLVIGESFIPWNMFVAAFIPNALMEYPELSPAAKLIYGRLSQRAGKDGECHPSQKKLAKECALAVKTVGTCIGRLESHKFIGRKVPDFQARAKPRSKEHTAKDVNTNYVFLLHRVLVESLRPEWKAALQGDVSGKKRLVIGESFNPWKMLVGAFVPKALMEYPRLSPAAKLIYGRLSQHAGEDGKCHPSQKKLAKECALGHTEVGTCIGRLESHKFIGRKVPDFQARAKPRSKEHTAKDVNTN